MSFDKLSLASERKQLSLRCANVAPRTRRTPCGQAGGLACMYTCGAPATPSSSLDPSISTSLFTGQPTGICMCEHDFHYLLSVTMKTTKWKWCERSWLRKQKNKQAKNTKTQIGNIQIFESKSCVIFASLKYFLGRNDNIVQQSNFFFTKQLHGFYAFRWVGYLRQKMCFYP